MKKECESCHDNIDEMDIFTCRNCGREICIDCYVWNSSSCCDCDDKLEK